MPRKARTDSWCTTVWSWCVSEHREDEVRFEAAVEGNQTFEDLLTVSREVAHGQALYMNVLGDAEDTHRVPELTLQGVARELGREAALRTREGDRRHLNSCVHQPVEEGAASDLDVVGVRPDRENSRVRHGLTSRSLVGVVGSPGA